MSPWTQSRVEPPSDPERLREDAFPWTHGATLTLRFKVLYSHKAPMRDGPIVRRNRSLT